LRVTIVANCQHCHIQRPLVPALFGGGFTGTGLPFNFWNIDIVHHAFQIRATDISAVMFRWFIAGMARFQFIHHAPLSTGGSGCLSPLR
jgi:hypothetical protein